MQSKDNSEALSLAQLFSTCVECFGLIHPGKEWDHKQRVLIAQLGIQQGRLLAWGDMAGITDLSPARDPRIDEPETRGKIEQALQSIIDRPAHTDRVTQFEKYGLKPPKKFTSSYQPALDTARLEAFREKLEVLQEQRWEVRRGMSITINHWTIVDAEKFKAYLDLIREKVDSLIELMDNKERVDRALKYDIKAFGWHPIFDKPKASADMSKLRLIKEACASDYPDYAAATQGALDYLDKEWKDSYQEAMERAMSNPRRGSGSEIPGAAAYMLAQSNQLNAAYKTQRSKRPGLFGMLRPKSWRKGSRDEGSPVSPEEPQKRSMSYTHPTPNQPLSPPLSPERSKSIAVLPVRPDSAEKPPTPGDEDLSQVETVKSRKDQADLGPIKSMISRHDQWTDPV